MNAHNDTVGSNMKEADGGDAAEALRDPRMILPTEVWLEVFKWLANPRDLLHVMEAHHVFEEILELGNPGVPGICKGALQLIEILPLVLKWLGKKDILSLREVGKHVCLTVDKVVSESPLISPYKNLNIFPWLMASPHNLSFESRRIKIPSDISPCVTLDSISKIDSFTQELEAKKVKKEKRKVTIPGDKIRVDVEIERELENEAQVGLPMGQRDTTLVPRAAFVEKMLELFTRFPEYIRYVNIVLRRATSFSTETYRLLQSIIGALPNLFGVEVHVLDATPFIENGEDLDLLKDFIAVHPLPMSPNLKRISSIGFPWPAPFLKEVADQYGGTLQELSMKVQSMHRYARGMASWEEFMQQYNFPALQQLSVSACMCSGRIVKLIEARDLKSLKITWGSVANLPLAFFTRQFPSLEEITYDDRTGDNMWDVNREVMNRRRKEISTVWQGSASLQKVIFIWRSGYIDVSYRK